MDLLCKMCNEKSMKFPCGAVNPFKRNFWRVFLSRDGLKAASEAPTPCDQYKSHGNTESLAFLQRTTY